MRSFLILVLLLGCPVRCFADDSADTLGPLVQLLAESDDAQFQLDILKGMSEALKGRAGMAMPQNWPAAAEKLSKSPNADVRAMGQSLSSFFGDPATMEKLKKVVKDKSAAADVRKKALGDLIEAKQKDLAPLLQELIADSDLRGQALRGLAGYDHPKTPAAILANYGTFSSTDKLDALNTLASRDAYAMELLKKLQDKTIPAKDVTPATVRQLSELKDERIDKWIATSWGSVKSTPEDKLAEMARIREVVKSARSEQVSASRGRGVFMKTCAQCHTLFGEGGKVGPDLTGSGRSDLEYILTNVVDPNAVVGKDYQVWLIRLKDKRLISGIISREDENGITVLTETETMVLPKGKIERMKQADVSMMPEGLLTGLEKQDLLDLISYLRSPSQVPLPANAAASK
ncbi:MAG TPA: c-type cytochrome [Tepidisphaeraceae bacterium]|nr:c-type cytochrome [Tepidisphaeraceae bacterium]